MLKKYYLELDFIKNSVTKLDNIYALFKKWASLPDKELAQIPEVVQIRDNLKSNDKFYEELSEIYSFVEGCKTVEKTAASFKDKIDIFKNHLPKELIEDISKNSYFWFEKKSSLHESDADMFYSSSKLHEDLPYVSIMLGVSILPSFSAIDHSNKFHKKADIGDDFAQVVANEINKGQYQITPANYAEVKSKLNDLIDRKAAEFKDRYKDSAQSIDQKAQQIKSILFSELDKYYTPIKLTFNKSLYYYLVPEDSLRTVVSSSYISDTRNKWNELVRNPEIKWAGNATYDLATDRLLALSKIAFAAAIERPAEITKFRNLENLNEVLKNSNPNSPDYKAAQKVGEYHNKYANLLRNYVFKGLNDDQMSKLTGEFMQIIWNNPTILFAASSKAYYTLVAASVPPDPNLRREILHTFLHTLAVSYQAGSPYIEAFDSIRSLLKSQFNDQTLVSEALSDEKSIRGIMYSIDEKEFNNAMVSLLNLRPNTMPKILRVQGFHLEPHQAVRLAPPNLKDPQKQSITTQNYQQYASEIEKSTSPLISSTQSEFSKRQADPSSYEWYDMVRKHWHWGFYGAGGLLGLLGILDLISRKKKSPGFMKLLLALGVAAIPFIYDKFFKGKTGITDVLIGKGEPPAVDLQPAPGIIAKLDKAEPSSPAVPDLLGDQGQALAAANEFIQNSSVNV
jgi:hypothetical protein